MAGTATRAQRTAGRGRPVGRDLSPQRPLVPGRLLLRGPQRPPDPGHAAHPAHGAVRLQPRSASSPPTTSSPSGPATSPATSKPLFDQDMMGDDLEAWMAESSMLRRTFRNVAVIAGLVDRNQPGAGTHPPPGHGQHRPDLRRAAQAPARPRPAARDLGRRGGRADRPGPGRRHAGARIAGRKVRHVRLTAVSPLAVPVLLDIGREKRADGRRARTICWQRPRRWSPKPPATLPEPAISPCASTPSTAPTWPSCSASRATGGRRDGRLPGTASVPPRQPVPCAHPPSLRLPPPATPNEGGQDCWTRFHLAATSSCSTGSAAASPRMAAGRRRPAFREGHRLRPARQPGPALGHRR